MSNPGAAKDLPTWEFASDGLFLTDEGFRILDVNPAGCAMLRLTHEELVGMNLAELMGVEERAADPPPDQEPAAGGPAFTPWTLRLGDGSTRLVEVASSRLPDGRLLSVARGRTEQVLIERRLAESEAGLARLLDSLPDGVIIHSQGRVVYVNRAAVDALGYAGPDELLGTPVAALVHPADRLAVEARLAALGAGGERAPPAEERLLRKDGSTFTLEVSAVRVVFRGEPSVLAVGRDTLDRRRLEARLAQTDRLASVGVVAAGVAHELNNPLTYVLLHLDAIEDLLRLRTLDPLSDHVGHVRSGLERVRDILRGVRSFARAGESVTTEADPRRAVELAVTMAGHEVRRRAHLDVRVPVLPAVRGDIGRIAQVLVNLLLNAAEAIPRDGRPHRVEVVGAANGEEVTIEVLDDGSGIDPDVLPRLFEPFFTTKPDGGTGLGLPISLDIVTSMGGTLEAANREGSGARFTVRLRRAEAVEAVEAPLLTPARIPILVVDDEAGIRTTLAGLLRERFEVHVAASGAEALRLLHRGLRVQAILCDLSMPVMTGADLYAALREQFPGLLPHFGIMTGGHTEDRAFRAELANRWLEKPATRSELTTLLLRLSHGR